MPIFEYKGINQAGKNKSGVIDAENLKAARARLKKDGIFVTDLKNKIKAQSKKQSSSLFQKNVPIKDLALMTRQLAVLIKSQIPLVDALAAVSEQVENPTLAVAMGDCKNMVNEGSPFFKSLAKYPHIFDNIYICMCEAGEMSGSLEVILSRLADFTESAAKLRQKVSSAMTYPIIMLVVVFIILMGLFTFVIPKMVTIFESAPELQLPWYTQVIIDISTFMTNFWYVILIVLGSVYFSFMNWKKSPTGRPQWDAISLKLPVFGPVIQMVGVSRFTRTLATLLTGGVPMLMALDIVRNVVDNEVIAKAIDDARNNISEGESIAGPLSRSGQFPPIVIHMVKIGEKTGELENMLTQVSDAYDFSVQNKIEGMTSLITPVITIIMGGVVMIIVLSIVIPMFEMTNLGQ
ncbi:MAG: type II secretion system inner membrane protein GspF [Bdellovibrionaceae bacterium]|nr:type II secretion system inner membrane protein GspF [Pseudobdellovibrionaceae bacterium]NUM57273.1 type II secretion system inner membrane protein GspF [Pseudobdellovibrionaceae bacterium]